jgi:hypothetical protein
MDTAAGTIAAATSADSVGLAARVEDSAVAGMLAGDSAGVDASAGVAMSVVDSAAAADMGEDIADQPCRCHGSLQTNPRCFTLLYERAFS